MAWSLLTLLVTFISCNAQHRRTINPLELRATKGDFFLYTLHSGNFFSQTVDVKWTASLRGRPALPLWLHLMPSRHKPLTYLYGTPVTPARQVVLHVIARRLDNFEKAEQFITIFISDNPRYGNTTQQIAEIRLKNYDPEDLIMDRTGLVQRLQSSLKESFRGRGLNPYIFEILPAGNIITEPRYYQEERKVGSIVRVGTQNRFHVNVLNLERGLHRNPQYCSRNSIVPLDKFFAPIFQVDWCNFKVKNITTVNVHSGEEWYDRSPISIIHQEARTIQTDTFDQVEPTVHIFADEAPIIHTRHYFWESFLMFPMLGVCCILLLILLSLIFFGRREGQHWRDYKTPKRQLEEYVSVRDSQRRLRELSIQRQMLIMASDKTQAQYPTGINTFLQPRSPSQNASLNYQIDTQTRRSRSPVSRDVHIKVGQDKTFSDGHFTPLGKQTVAEAAKACGSSLHLYRNPFETSKDEDNDFDEELSREEERRSDDRMQETPIVTKASLSCKMFARDILDKVASCFLVNYSGSHTSKVLKDIIL